MPVIIVNTGLGKCAPWREMICVYPQGVCGIGACSENSDRYSGRDAQEEVGRIYVILNLRGNI